MKKIMAATILLLLTGTIFSQWTEVNNDLPNLQVTTLTAWLDTIIVGTDGDGLFRSTDNGDTWVDINGDIGNKHINDVRGGPIPTNIFVATDDGPYYTEDLNTYQYSTNGLTTTNINYYWFGGDDPVDWAIASEGGGVFLADEHQGPWATSNSGISGDGLIVRNMVGYSEDEEEYAAIGTAGGVYVSSDNMSAWKLKNGTLTGDDINVNSVLMVGGTLLMTATPGGLNASTDFGENWLALVDNEYLNVVAFIMNSFKMGYFAFGESGLFSADFTTWEHLDMTGVSGGNVTCYTSTSQYLFVGTENGGVFRIDWSQLITTDVDDELSQMPGEFRLEQNYPNPFNPTTKIGFSIPFNTEVNLSVYNTLGERVTILKSGFYKAGEYEAEFNAENLPSGIYFYRLQAGNFQQTRKLVLVR